MESTPHHLGATFADRDHRAEMVDRLYDVAVDPIRLEELLEVWEGRAGPLRVGSVESAIPLEDPEIEAHLARATVFLDRFEASQTLPGARWCWRISPARPRFSATGGQCWRAATGRRGWRFRSPKAGLSPICRLTPKTGRCCRG